jgi:hypothetical protein
MPFAATSTAKRRQKPPQALGISPCGNPSPTHPVLTVAGQGVPFRNLSGSNGGGEGWSPAKWNPQEFPCSSSIAAYIQRVPTLRTTSVNSMPSVLGVSPEGRTHGRCSPSESIQKRSLAIGRRRPLLKRWRVDPYPIPASLMSHSCKPVVADSRQNGSRLAVATPIQTHRGMQWPLIHKGSLHPYSAGAGVK